MTEGKAVWPLAAFLAEEMQTRKWTCVDVAQRMGGQYDLDVGVINFVLAIEPEKMKVDFDLIRRLALAFDVTPSFLHGLHQQWVDNPDGREPFECPDELFDGLVFPGNDNPPAPQQGEG